MWHSSAALKNLSVYDRTVGALLPIGKALTIAKPRKLDTEYRMKDRKKERKKEFSTCRSRAYYVSAGQKKIFNFLGFTANFYIF